MGRVFSTVYRVVLVVMSISALVLSIMSATSCAFVNFDHQYKHEGRFLQVTEEGTPAEAPGPGDGTAEVPAMTAEAPADDTAEEPAAVEAPADDTSEEPAAVEAPVDEDPVDEQPTDSWVDGMPPAEDSSVAGPILDATAPPEFSQGMVDPTTFVDATPVPEEGVGMAAFGMDEDEDSFGEDSSGFGAGPGSSKFDNMPSDEDEDTDTASGFGAGPGSSKFDNMPSDEDEDEDYGSGYGAGPGSSKYDSPPEQYGEGAFGAASDEASATAASEPVATASGQAGLFCAGEQEFSVTNLWGGSIQELEQEINEESDSNQSEEIARNAVLAAAVFGSVATFVLVLESMIGWRICLERWIVGLISLCACICQGLSFLFFNSERYCDGDIVHEILNQEPCVMGQGAVFSVISLTLYAVMVIMSCRLPSDDPYGLCCKKDSTKSEASSGKFSFIGSKKSEGSERPWVTEDGKEKDENEII